MLTKRSLKACGYQILSGSRQFRKRSNVSKYDGEWKNGDSNGHGIAYYADGNIYDGEWKDRLKNGNGQLIFPNGSIIKGNWKDGQMCGKAIKFEPNGKISKINYQDGEGYEGELKNGKRHGHGTIYDQKGKIKYYGEWKKGKLIDDSEAPASTDVDSNDVGGKIVGCKGM